MSTSPAPISKREQKRQAKLAKELAEKNGSNGVTPSSEPTLETLPIVDADTNGAAEATTTDQKPSPFIEPVQKRSGFLAHSLI